MYVFFVVFSIYLIACLLGYVNPSESVLLRDAGIYSKYNIQSPEEEYSDESSDEDTPQEPLRRSLSE